MLMDNCEKISSLKIESAQMVYNKYLHDYYAITACRSPFVEELVIKNTLLIDLLSYQESGSYINCEL